MRRRAFTLLLLLMASVTLCLAIPQTDLPETNYDEVDAPLNQAPPAFRGISFVRPPVTAVILSRHIAHVGRRVAPPSVEQKRDVRFFPRDPHSLQDLFCVFLI